MLHLLLYFTSQIVVKTSTSGDVLLHTSLLLIEFAMVIVEQSQLYLG